MLSTLGEGRLDPVRPNRPRLLAIDDEPSVVGFISHVARTCGYDPMATTDTGTFAEQYERCVPDIVCLDLELRQGDGVEQLRFLADQRCQAAVIIISGLESRVINSACALGEALGLRMLNPLSKPLRVQSLRDALPRMAKSLHGACPFQLAYSN